MSNAQQTIHLAIQRALNEAPHAPACRSWRVLVPDMTRDELENGGAEQRLFALETREKACNCYRSDLVAALDLVKGYPPPNAGTCRLCGCTETNPCMDLETGLPCAWVDKSQTLCTVCAKDAQLQELTDEVGWFHQAALGLGPFVGADWAKWLAHVIGRICLANAGPYLYDTYLFLEKGLVPLSAEALYIDATGGRMEYLLGRFEAIAMIACVDLPESPAVAAAPNVSEALLPKPDENAA